MTKSSVDSIQLNSASVKIKLSKHIVEHLDRLISEQVAKSPLFSLSIELNECASLAHVYIKFLNNSKHSVEKELLKIIELATKNAVGNDDKVKFLCENINDLFSPPYNLNKQDLAQVCVDFRLLREVQVSSFFSNFKDESLNDFLIFLPCFNIIPALCDELTAWHNGNFSLKSYFSIYKSLVRQLSHSNIRLVEFKSESKQFKFDHNKLSHYLQIFESVYINFSSILINLEQNSSEKTQKLFKILNKIDFYYMTCLFRDLFKFLLDFQNQNNLSIMQTPPTFPWYKTGSYLQNLIKNQLVDANCKNSGNFYFSSPTEVNLKSSLEADSDQLGRMEKVKHSLEKIIFKIFNAQIEEYLTSAVPLSDKFSSMVKAYRDLYEMFDVSLSCIEPDSSGKLKFICAETNDFENLLKFYMLKDICDSGKLKELRALFFDTFLTRLSATEREELARIENKSEHHLLGTKTFEWMHFKMIEFVNGNNQRKDKNFSIMSFFATTFLCLQPILSVQNLYCNYPKGGKSNENEDDSLFKIFENKVKIINGLGDNLDLCYAFMCQLPVIDFF